MQYSEVQRSISKRRECKEQENENRVAAVPVFTMESGKVGRKEGGNGPGGQVCK